MASSVHKHARALKRLLERLLKVTDKDEQADVAKDIDSIAYILHNGNGVKTALDPYCPGFALSLINAISYSVRRITLQQLDVATLHAWQACWDVLAAFYPHAQPVASALLRGDILTLLAEAFASTCVDSRAVGGGDADLGDSAGGNRLNMNSNSPVTLAFQCRGLQLYAQLLMWVVMSHVSSPELRTEAVAALARSGVLEQAAAALLRLTVRLNGGAPRSTCGGSAGRHGESAAEDCSQQGVLARGDAPSQPRPPAGAAPTAPHSVYDSAAPEQLWRWQQISVDGLLTSILFMLQGHVDSWVQACASRHRFAVEAAEEPAAAEAEERWVVLEQLRGVVCGPAVQLLLLACADSHAHMSGAAPAAGSSCAGVRLLGQEPQQQRQQQQQGPEARQRLRMRWTAVQVDAPKDAQGRYTTLELAMQSAALVFQLTLSPAGGGVIPVAQPPPGLLNPPYPQPLARPRHLSPYTSAVHVYDVVAAVVTQWLDATAAGAAAAGATVAASARAEAASTSGGAAAPAGSGGGGAGDSDDGVTSRERVRRCSVERMCSSLQLLDRLLPELRPRQAAARLPGLWRAHTAVLSTVASSCYLACVWSVLSEASVLLRLRVCEDGAATALGSTRQQEEAMEGGSSSKPPPGVPLALPPGAKAAAGGCSYSLRCALGAGLLPALEQLLRTVFSNLSSNKAATAAAGGAAPELTYVEGMRAVSATHAVGSLLLASGVFPAVLAHGCPTQVVPLLATMACVLRRLTAAAAEVGHLPLERPPRPGFLVTTHFDGIIPLAHLWFLLLASLSRQATALAMEAGKAANVAQAGADGMDVCGWLRPARIDPGWLEEAGGAPPPGSVAAAQQADMRCLLLHTWLTPLLGAMPVWDSKAQGGDGDNPAGLSTDDQLELAHELAAQLTWVCYADLRTNDRPIGAVSVTEENQQQQQQQQQQRTELLSGGAADAGGGSSSSRSRSTGRTTIHGAAAAAEAVAAQRRQALVLDVARCHLDFLLCNDSVTALASHIVDLLRAAEATAAAGDQAVPEAEAEQQHSDSAAAAAGADAAAAGACAGPDAAGAAAGVPQRLQRQVRPRSAAAVAAASALLDLLEADLACRTDPDTLTTTPGGASSPAAGAGAAAADGPAFPPCT